MMQAISPNFKLAGIIQTAHARMEPPPRQYLLTGIRIDLYAISEEQFRTHLQTLLSDRNIFNALLILAAHDVKVEISGAFGEWIHLSELGVIRIRHDTGICRIKEFFGILTTEKE